MSQDRIELKAKKCLRILILAFWASLPWPALSAGLPVAVPDDGTMVSDTFAITSTDTIESRFNLWVQLTSPVPQDLAFLLVGPTGANCLFMSGAGGTTAVTNVNL